MLHSAQIKVWIAEKKIAFEYLYAEFIQKNCPVIFFQFVNVTLRG